MSLLSDDIKMRFGYDDQMLKFLDDLGCAMVSYYGEGFLEKIKYTLNNVPIVKCSDKEGFEIIYKSNSIKNFNPFMKIRINGQNGSRYNLIKYIVEALMTSIDVGESNFVEKVGIATYTYSVSGYNDRIIVDGNDSRNHQEFEQAATEFDALMIYNLLYSNNKLDYSVLSDNGKKAAVLLEYPIARDVVNDRRIKNDFLLSTVPNSSLLSEDEMKDLRHFVIGYINSFPNSLKEYKNDIEKIADGTVENCETNEYNHLNKLRKVFHIVK